LNGAGEGVSQNQESKRRRSKKWVEKKEITNKEGERERMKSKENRKECE